jgi:hypothetical protein
MIAPEAIPTPLLGVKPPSFEGDGRLSVNDDSPGISPRTTTGAIVRPVCGSVKRIGSKSCCDVGAGLFSQSGFPQAPLNVTRSVCTSD